MAVGLLTRLGQMELRSVRRARHPSQAGYRYRPTTRVQRDAYAAGYKFIVIVPHLGIAVHLSALVQARPAVGFVEILPRTRPIGPASPLRRSGPGLLRRRQGPLGPPPGISLSNSPWINSRGQRQTTEGPALLGIRYGVPEPPPDVAASYFLRANSSWSDHIYIYHHGMWSFDPALQK